MKRLDGKVALFSGTARGQGRAAALRFAAEGALVVGGDLRHEGAVETQRLIAREGGTALTTGPVDVTDEDSVRTWAEEAADAFGGIDNVHANAGAVRFGPVDGQLCDDFASPLRAELKSVWLTAHAAWSHVIRSRGRVLTGGWTPVVGGSPTNGHIAKGGLTALTRHIAAEGAPYGIRPTASPRRDRQRLPRRSLAEDHPMRDIARHIPLSRVGACDDVVEAAVSLASDEAAHITGTHPVVDDACSTVLPGAAH